MAKKKSTKKKTNKKNPRKNPQKKPVIRLSQCMIVKNEEKNIEQALSWGKDIMYEQIVVDTGSTDRTVEIAEKMGAKVMHFEWIDDFAAAKNFAIEQAKGNWIAFLDADEYFQEEDVKKLMPVLEHIHPKKDIDFVRSNMAHLKADGTIASYAPQDRIFRNTPYMRYKYRIHEELHNTQKEEMGCFDALDGLLIIHTGYANDEKKPAKGERNARILKMDLEENPYDAMRLMYLGDAYNIADKEEEALECFRKVLWDPQMKTQWDIVYLRSGLQMMRIHNYRPWEEVEEEVLKVAETLRQRCGNIHPDIDYYVGMLYVKKQELSKAAELFESALDRMKTYRGEEVATIADNLSLVNAVIAGQALNKGDLQKAVQFSVAALQADKFSPDGLKFLLVAFGTEYKPGMSVDPYWQFLFKLYDMSNPKDLLFIHRMASEVGFVELQGKVYDALPPEIQERLQ